VHPQINRYLSLEPISNAGKIKLNIMKNLYTWAIIILATFTFTACGDEDPEECVPGTLVETLVGSWDTPQLNPSVPIGEVTFNADGTGSTTESSAFDRGDLEFDWTYNNADSVLMVGIYIYKINSFDCDAINLNSIVDFTITRK